MAKNEESVFTQTKVISKGFAMQKKFLKLHGLKHRYFFWGSAKNPPLFLVHGWLDTGAAFDFFCKHLEKKYFCVAPDLRGYGKSQHSLSPLGYFFYEYVADVAAGLDRLFPGEAVHLLGHSLGGAILSVYAGTFPERVRSFVNLEGFLSSRRAKLDPAQRLRLWWESLDKNRFRIFADNTAFAERLRQNFPKLTLSQVKFLARYLTEPVKGGVRMAADPRHKTLEPYPLHAKNLVSFWQKITAPSLFVVGEKTEFAGRRPQSFFRRLEMQHKEFPPHTHLHILPEARHSMHLENSEELAQLVLKFLSK